MPNTKFIVRDISFSELINTEKITIPKFQRKFVWKKEKKQDLIISIKKGYPIGSITIYDNEQKWFLIDGLQRISTIKQYINTPSEIFSFRALKAHGLLKDLEKYVEESFENALKIINTIKKWYENDFDGNIHGLINFMNKYCKGLIEDEMKIEELHNVCKKTFSIENFPISFIMYQGSWDEVAEIFQYINSGSVILTKYEVYAAIWYKYEVINLPEYYIEKIKKQTSKAITDNDLDIIDDNLIIDIPKYSILELLSVFSKEIVECDPKGKIIVTSRNAKRLEHELCFEIIATLIEFNPSKIQKVIQNIYSNNDLEKISKFVLDIQKQIINATNYLVQEKSSANISYYHQYLFLVCSYIHTYYEIDVATLMLYRRSNPNIKALSISYDIEKQNKEKWFRGDNRQVTFLTEKIRKHYEEC